MSEEHEEFGMEVGGKIRALRQRGGVTLRELSRRAGIAVSYLSSLERDKVSPTLATLRKILVELGTNFAEFFGQCGVEGERNVFRHSSMKSVHDADREYNIVFPRRDGIGLEMVDEIYHYNGKIPAYETFDGEFAGYVISGNFVIEFNNAPPVELFAGDAFHIPAGTPIRGYCRQGARARVVTIWVKSER